MLLATASPVPVADPGAPLADTDITAVSTLQSSVATTKLILDVKREPTGCMRNRRGFSCI